MHPMLNIAIRAAREVGSFIFKNYEILDISNTNKDSNNNFIAKIDQKAGQLIIDIIHKFYPQHAILSKNNNLFDKDNDIQWIISPLNGKNNFIKRFPYFAISIAIRIKRKTEVAVIYDPMRNELFTASRGCGAQLNRYRLRCSTSYNPKSAILATNIPFNYSSYVNEYLILVNKLLTCFVDFRHAGSPALDFAYVAAGRVDGLFEKKLHLCDFASGELLVREAGGLVTDFTGGDNHYISGDIVAANPRITKVIVAIIRNEFKDILKN